MKAKFLEKTFDNDDFDIIDALDLSKISRPGQLLKRVSMKLPAWMIESLDKEASRLGVTRQFIIKIRLAERLENAAVTAKRG